MQRQTGVGKETFAAVLGWLRGVPVANRLMVLVLAVAYLLPMAAVDYRSGSLATHAWSVVSHANIFHLMANAYCVLLFRWTPRWLLAFLVAVVSTFIPSPVWSWSELGFVTAPTCGASGMILAAMADGFARAGKWKELVKYVVIPILPLTIVPNINTPIHLYCIIIAYTYTTITKRMR